MTDSSEFVDLVDTRTQSRRRRIEVPHLPTPVPYAYLGIA